MNKRIKELSAEAWKYAKKTVGYNESGYHDAFEQKFAELIVRECSKVADLADENKCEWIGGNILTHFGVEE
jgi:hypothetical protein